MFSPKTVFITGANRGLGLEFVKQLLKLANPPKLLFATCRDPEKGQELQRLAEANSTLKVIKLDVTDVEEISTARQKVESILGQEGLNLLINNSGVNFKMGLREFTAEKIDYTYRVNVIAPMLISQSFLPLLKKAVTESEDRTLSPNRAAIVNLSSELGSIERNQSGGLHGYRPSKAALNMFTKSLSVELKGEGILAVALHPGWVQTDMGGPKAPLSKEESVAGCLRVIGSLNEESNGKLIDYTGKVLPW